MPGLHLLLPLGREKQLWTEKGRDQSASLLVHKAMEKVESEGRPPAPLCILRTMCAWQLVQWQGLLVERKPNRVSSSALLP